MIRHYVVMKFTDAGDAPAAKQRLESLVGVVPEIDTLRVDLDTVGSPTGHHLALVTEHADALALKGYQSHPAHLDVAQWLKARLADRVVVDTEI